MLHVVLHLVVRERVQLVVYQYALPELAETVLTELVLELGLAHQDDLQEFLLVSLEIG